MAEKGTGDPMRPVTVAEADCEPDTVPSVQVVDACPLAFVVTVVLPTDPLPAAKVTSIPLIALPYWSVTLATIGDASWVLTVAFCPPPET